VGNNEDAMFAGGKIFQEDLRDVISMQLTGTPHALLVADGIGGLCMSEIKHAHTDDGVRQEKA
jgi:hypothetical protein